MKFLSIVLYVFAVAASIVIALGDEVTSDHGNPTSAGGGEVCDVHLDENDTEHDIVDLLVDKMFDCLAEEAKNVKQAIHVSHTTEEYRDVIKTACEKLPTISACTANVAASVHTCLNESNTASFKVVRNDLDTLLTVVCQDEGVKVADIVKEVGDLREKSVDTSVITGCLTKAQGEIRDLDGNDPSKVSVSLFRLLKVLKECIADRGQGQDPLNKMFESIFGDIARKMKCIHPVSHAEVLCESFA